MSAKSPRRRPVPALKPEELDRLPLEVLRLRLQQANLVSMGRHPQLLRRLKEHTAAQTRTHSGHGSSSASHSNSSSSEDSPSSEESHGDSSSSPPDSSPTHSTKTSTETELGTARHPRGRFTSSSSSRNSSVSTKPAKRSRRHLQHRPQTQKPPRPPSPSAPSQQDGQRTTQGPTPSPPESQRPNALQEPPTSASSQTQSRRQFRPSHTPHPYARGSPRRRSCHEGSRRVNSSRHRRSVHDRLGPTPSPRQ